MTSTLKLEPENYVVKLASVIFGIFGLFSSVTAILREKNNLFFHIHDSSEYSQPGTK